MRIAVLQFDPDPDPEANAALLTETAARAAEDQVDLLLAPEGSIVSYLTDSAAVQRAAQPLDGPFATAVLAASAQYGLTIAAGTFVPDPQSDRAHNTLLIATGGKVAAAYQKIHLYDAFSYTESDTVAPGHEPPPVLQIGDLTVGFATCYDLRFPELFRSLQQRGAQVLALASAWVRGPLKEEHWLTLLRARAIENTSYVVAADQVGRAAIGRSALFDPMGLQLADMGVENPAYAVADLDPGRVAQVREALPSTENARMRIEAVPG